MVEDQISLKEFIDPFTGSKNAKAKKQAALAAACEMMCDWRTFSRILRCGKQQALLGPFQTTHFMCGLIYVTITA